MKYSTRTDVFAFGVLLFEIFAAQRPWPNCRNNVAAVIIFVNLISIYNLEKIQSKIYVQFNFLIQH